MNPLDTFVVGDGVLDYHTFFDKDNRTMNDSDYGLLKMQAHQRMERDAQGDASYRENLRYDYLEGKANVSMTEGLGIRYIQGPHPQYGSPDAPARTGNA